MDCCVGKTRINFGKWYCPHDKTPEEFTYCEYCYNNGCVDKSTVYDLQETLDNLTEAPNCNCDCPNQESHPLLSAIMCPICEISSYGMMQCCACGNCKKCGILTPYSGECYCIGCSYQLKACYDCGESVKDGNTYIPEIEELVIKLIEREKGLMENMVQDDKWAKYLENSINQYNYFVLHAKESYADKTVDEMTKILTGQ